MKHTFIKKIFETDLDLFGHVNHAKYLVYYEQARWQWLNDKNVFFEDLMKTGKGLVILNANINYSKEVKARKNLIIETDLLGFEKKIFKIKQVMKTEGSNDINSDIILTGGIFDLKKRKLVEPDDIWLKIFSTNT